MSERLDQIENILLAITKRLDSTNATLDQTNATLAQTNATLAQTNATLAQTNATLGQVVEQQERNTTDIDNLVGVASNTEVEIRLLKESIVEMRESMATNYAELRESIAANYAELRELIAANEKRFNILIQEMRADRRTNQRAFQALLLQLTDVSDRVDDLEAS